jgi:hypothetical protein
MYFCLANPDQMIYIYIRSVENGKMKKDNLKMVGNCPCRSPTGHPNQIVEAIQRQELPIVRQSLQIFHKIYRNLSRRGH